MPSVNEYTGTSDFNDMDLIDHPVIYISWNQAETYCKWRKSQLPTEAQWEKAARGIDGRIYPWGNEINSDKANYRGHTTVVGSFEDGKSPYGIYDLSGNVSEWVADWYSETYYQISPSSNPTGPDSGQYKVFRGGSLYDSEGDRELQSSFRKAALPDKFGSNVGFCCARNP